MNEVNVISNIVILVSVIYFLTNVLKDKSLLDKYPFMNTIFLRAMLSFTGIGSLMNIVYHPHPHITEIILNIGLGGLFVWAAHFHHKYIYKTNVST